MQQSIKMEEQSTRRALQSVMRHPPPNFADHDDAVSRTPRHDQVPKNDVPKCVTVVSHTSENTKVLREEASYQAALTALNKSFLSKPPVKTVIRKEMYNKIWWDGQEQTFMAFKKQYKAYLMTSLQDYATNPAFCSAYIQHDSSFFNMCLKYEVSHAQVKSDTKQQYGTLAMACSGNDNRQRFLTKYPRDGIRNVKHTEQNICVNFNITKSEKPFFYSI
jgi:hypothetical protein